MGDFTVSSANLISNCRYPFRSDVVAPEETAPDADQAKGTGIHGAIAMLVNDGEEVANDLGPTWLCARAWIQANMKPTWVAEPAYAWNPVADTARGIGVNIGRDYAKHGKLPDEKGGTLDVCSLEGDTVYIYEFGTGHDVSHKFDQLRLQCAVAALAHGCTKAVGQLVRFADDGTYPSQPVEYDEFALAAIRGEFTEYLGEVAGSEPTPGEHCSRCKLAPVCPAAADIVQALIPAAALVKPGWGLAISTPDHARWLLDHARLVAAAAEAVKDAVKAYVPKEGLVLEDGSLLVEGTRNMPRRDNKKLEALARACGATEEQIAGCDYVAVESSGLRVKKATKSRKKAA